MVVSVREIEPIDSCWLSNTEHSKILNLITLLDVLHTVQVREWQTAAIIFVMKTYCRKKSLLLDRYARYRDDCAAC